MKTLCFLFAVAFLVFQLQAKPNLSTPDTKEVTKVPAPPLYVEDDRELPNEKAAAARFTTFACFQNFGYCLPRDWQCFSGLVFREAYNDCPLPGFFKCCV